MKQCPCEDCVEQFVQREVNKMNRFLTKLQHPAYSRKTLSEMMAEIPGLS